MVTSRQCTDERTESSIAVWDTVAARWQENGARLWRQASDLVNLRWLASVAPPLLGTRVFKTDLFDEAFSHGLLGWAAEQGALTVAADLSFSVVRAASFREPRFRPLAADVRHIPFATGSCGVVLSISTLDHLAGLTEVADALREFGRVLRPGGTLLLTMDNPRNPLIFVRELMPALTRKLGIMAFPPGVMCGPGRLRTMVEDAGFVVETARAIFHVPRFAVVRICNWLERRGRTSIPNWLSALVLGGERLGRSPARHLSGHFLAISARRL